jgi:hypothetical protein
MNPGGHAWLEVVADTAAETKHAVADIINVMLEELVHHRYELPAFSTLDRMAYRAREKSNNRYFSAITNQLTAHTRTLIDSLLKTATGESVSAWQMLKREPKRPTNKETRTWWSSFPSPTCRCPSSNSFATWRAPSMRPRWPNSSRKSATPWR